MAKKPKHDPFETIDERRLDVVSGGQAVARAPISATSATGSSNPLMTALTQIESTLASMAQANNPMQEFMQLWEFMHNVGSPAATIPGNFIQATKSSTAPWMAASKK